MGCLGAALGAGGSTGMGRRRRVLGDSRGCGFGWYRGCGAQVAAAIGGWSRMEIILQHRKKKWGQRRCWRWEQQKKIIAPPRRQSSRLPPTNNLLRPTILMKVTMPDKLSPFGPTLSLQKGWNWGVGLCINKTNQTQDVGGKSTAIAILICARLE